MNQPAPTAIGTLEATPLLNLAVYALDRQLTGTVVLEEPDGQKHAVYFMQGAPTKARVAAPIAFLGHVLVDFGNITEDTRARSFEEAQTTRRLHGEVLLTAGLIDMYQLKDTLREQVVRKMLYMAGRVPQTVWGYYDGVDFLDQWGGGEAIRGKPLALIWRLVDHHARPAHVSEVLQRLGDMPLRLHFEAPIVKFHFARPEQSVIDVLRAKPQPLAELLDRELAERGKAERVIYALAITRQLDLGIPGVEPIGVDEAPSSSRIPAVVEPIVSVAPQEGFGATYVPNPSSSPPVSPPVSRRIPSQKPEITAFRIEIRERARRLDQTLYEVLGVTKDTTPAAIQAAFFELAKKWHPDRLGPELEDLRELATRVFAKMSEAQHVLCDHAQRREYDQKIRKAGQELHEQEHVQRVLRAATSFQKADVLLKRNNLAQAEVEARQALADDPEQAEYMALVAWIDAQKPNANIESLIRVLDRALHLQPNNIRSHWYRGQLYKRLGKDSRAVQDFRFICERDPRHLDAQREIRLYQMRRSGSRASSSYPPASGASASHRPSPLPPSQDKSKGGEGAGGLISKFFKR